MLFSIRNPLRYRKRVRTARSYLVSRVSLNLELLEDRLAPATYTVINTLDSGAGSLRQAILDANAHVNVGSPDVIDFNIPGSGVHTISPITALPAISVAGGPVIIDGYTQPGASPNTNPLALGSGALGTNANLLIQLSGAALVSSQHLLNIAAGNSTVRGLVFADMRSTAFALFLHTNGGNRIEGNFIGTDPTGAMNQSGSGGAIQIFSGNNNIIGGTDPDARNLISSVVTGIALSPSVSTGNVVAGNFIGTDRTGTIVLGIGQAAIAGASGSTIGGTVIGAGNVIAGNSNTTAMSITGDNNLIQGNLIGTDLTGTFALGNQDVGVLVQSIATGNVIGGADAGDGVVDGVVRARNVISGNKQGVVINGPNNRVEGNFIGTDISGVLALGNTIHGVNVANTSNVTVGGTAPGAGNVIAFNGGVGVRVNPNGTGILIQANSIHSNGQLGINLVVANDPLNLVTANDPGDADSGVNNLQNFPVLTSATRSGGITTVTGMLNSTANTTFRLEFFANTALDPTGFGEGQRYLNFHTVTTDTTGNVSFSIALTAATTAGEFITATATDPGNNTSEFSQGPTVVFVNASPVADAGVNQEVDEGVVVHFDGTDSSDPDADTLTYAWDFGDGATGTGPTPSHTYADDGNYVVTLTVDDGKGGTNSDTLTVTVNNVDPSAGDDSVTTSEDQAVSIAVLTNDSDIAGAFDPLQIVSVTNGAKGVTSIDTRGTVETTDDEIIYTHDPGVTGSDSFTYTISDGDGGTATATVMVEIGNLVDVSGRVFDDRDNDGNYEPADGDAGIEGVRVDLQNESTGDVIATRWTAADGSYFFNVNLGTGSYRIVAAQASGFLDGRETAGNLGGTVDNTQDSNQIASINIVNPGATPDAIDYLFAEVLPSQMTGLVWVDGDNGGDVDVGEPAIAAVNIELTGRDDRGNPVSYSVSTDTNGRYAFNNLRPSDSAGYTIHEIQPGAFQDGSDVLGTINGVVLGDNSVNDTFARLIMQLPNSLAENYNFGERATSEPPAAAVRAGQTATIGFWQNKNGQKLITSLNGGPTSKQLGNWLAANFPNMYGAGGNNLAGKTNAQVAAFYKSLFARTARSAAGGGPPKMDAQVMATALACYVTNQSLAGSIAQSYGFAVTAGGVGVNTFNVGNAGAAFGVANYTTVTVIDLLRAVDQRSHNGLLYDLDSDGDANDALETSYRTMANKIFSGINEAGDI